MGDFFTSPPILKKLASLMTNSF